MPETITFDLSFVFSVGAAVLIALVSIWGFERVRRLISGRR